MLLARIRFVQLLKRTIFILGRLILNSGRAAARPYIRLDGIYSHMQLTTWNCSSQRRSYLKSENRLFPREAELASKSPPAEGSIATWDVLPSLASADAFRRLASYSVLSDHLAAIPDHLFRSADPGSSPG